MVIFVSEMSALIFSIDLHSLFYSQSQGQTQLYKHSNLAGIISKLIPAAAKFSPAAPVEKINSTPGPSQSV